MKKRMSRLSSACVTAGVTSAADLTVMPMQAASTKKTIPRRLIIDHHAPGNAPDRYRDDRLAAFDVNDSDIVAEAVRDEQLRLVARERDAPGALADQDVAQNLAGR